jgi:hypothetical protein
MSIYEVNKVGYKIVHDREFRERAAVDPAGALDAFDLEPEERQMVLDGDVAGLYLRGAHEFLLFNLARMGAFGLNMGNYPQRIRAAAGHEDEK